MHDTKITSRCRPLLPAAQRTAWTRQDLLTLYPFSYNFWAKVPHSLLPCIQEGKTYVYDSCDVVAFLVRLKRSTLAALIDEVSPLAPRSRKRGRPRKTEPPDKTPQR